MTHLPALADSLASDFVGRTAELESMRALLGEAAGGQTRLVLVSGEPGMGKTRLVEESVREVPASRVLWGRCRDAEGMPAYWPWTQALRAHVSHLPPARLEQETRGIAADLARVIPALGTLGAHRGEMDHEAAETRFQLFEALRDFLERAATDELLVLVLDDLHWADSESLLLLRFLGTELDGARLCVVGTYREVEMRQSAAVPRILADLARIARRLQLAGLAAKDVAALASKQSAGLPEAAIDQVHRVTEGNPFFVREVLALLRRDGWEESTRVPIPHEVRDVIRSRLDPLAEGTRRLLSAASILGREVDANPLGRLVGRPTFEVLSELSEPIAIGLLTEAPGATGRLRFSHALVQDTLYDDLSAAERARLHRAAGELLESGESGIDAKAGEIAHHLYRAADIASLERAASWSVRAAEHAQAHLGYEEAVGHYERALTALATLRRGQRDRLPLLLALGDMQASAGDLEGHRATLMEAARVARELGDVEAFAAAALGYGRVPPQQTVDRLHVGLLEEARRALSGQRSSLHASVLSALALALYNDSDIAARDEITREAVAMAREVGDPATLAEALRTLFYCLEVRHVTTRLEALRECATVAEASGQAALACEAWIKVAAVQIEQGDVVAADRTLPRAYEIADRLRIPRERWRVEVMKAARALIAGNLADAEMYANQAAKIGRYGAHESDVTSHWSGLLFYAWGAQGRLAEFAPQIAALVQHSGGPVSRAALAQVHAETGNLSEAAELLRDLVADGFEQFRRDWSRVPSLATLAGVAHAVGDAAVASAIAPVLESEAPPVIMTPAFCLGSRDRYLGLLALVTGRLEDAIGHFARAQEVNERLGARIELARTRVGLARSLLARGSDGDGERASAELSQAESVGRQLGLGQVLAEIEATRASGSTEPRRVDASPLAAAGVLRREGSQWMISCAAESTRIPDTKGVAYLMRLLASPGQEIHVLELVGASGEQEASEDTRRERLRTRALELREELVEAEGFSDVGRVARLREELEEVADALTGMLGSGRTPEVAAREAERARVNVTRAIGAMMRRVERDCPGLGRHLGACLRTGTLCVYQPDPGYPVTWEVPDFR